MVQTIMSKLPHLDVLVDPRPDIAVVVVVGPTAHTHTRTHAHARGGGKRHISTATAITAAEACEGEQGRRNKEPKGRWGQRNKGTEAKSTGCPPSPPGEKRGGKECKRLNDALVVELAGSQRRPDQADQNLRTLALCCVIRIVDIIDDVSGPGDRT